MAIITPSTVIPPLQVAPLLAEEEGRMLQFSGGSRCGLAFNRYIVQKDAPLDLPPHDKRTVPENYTSSGFLKTTDYLGLHECGAQCKSKACRENMQVGGVGGGGGCCNVLHIIRPVSSATLVHTCSHTSPHTFRLPIGPHSSWRYFPALSYISTLPGHQWDHTAPGGLHDGTAGVGGALRRSHQGRQVCLQLHW